MDRLSLLESHEFRGQWWLPGRREKGVPGSLKYDPQGGIELLLEGHLEEDAYALITGPRIIHGVDLGARPITLHRTSHRGRSSAYTQVAGIDRDSYWIGSAVFGLHAEGEDALKFKSCSFGLPGIVEWLHKPGFAIEPAHDLGESEFSVKVFDETVCEVLLPSHGNARVALFSYTERSEAMGRHLELRAAPFFAATFDEPKAVQDYVKLANVFRVLFSLLEQRAESISWMTIDLPDVGPAGFSTYSTLFDALPSSKPKEKPSFRMFLPYFRSAPFLKELIEKWCASEELFGEIRYEYLRTQLSMMPASPEENILTLTQLLEGFHRRTSTETLLAAEVFEEQVRAVKASLPVSSAPELSERLSEWLQFANELNLRRRMRRMVDDVHQEIRDAITTSVKSFVNRAVRGRNTLTHNLPEDTDGGTGDDPLGTSVRLRALLLAQLFLSCGVPATTIAEGLKAETIFQALPGGYRRTVI
jgi:ApeA N-terminal domain 1